MKPRYHYNPKSGYTGVCDAKIKCRFGMGPEDHYPTRWEAMKAYEESQADRTFDKPLKKASSSKKAAAPANPSKEAGRPARMGVSELREGAIFVRPHDEARTQYTVISIPDKSDMFGKFRTNRGLVNFGRDWQTASVEVLNPPKGYKSKEPAEKKTAAPRPVRIPKAGGVATMENVLAIARQATSHNSGEAVLEHREGSGQFELKMSSWPRALEVKKACEAEGLMAEFGANEQGQWLRVQRKPSPEEYVDTSALSWSPENECFVEEISTLGSIPRYIRSNRNGELAELNPPVAHRDEEGEITHWTLTPYSPMRGWTVTVFND